MTITADTSLNEILNSNMLINKFENENSIIRENTSPRLSTLKAQVSSDTIQNSTFDGESLMGAKGQEVIQEFYTFHRSLTGLFLNMKRAAANKEMEELSELRKAVTAKIEEIGNEIDVLDSYYNGRISQEAGFGLNVEAVYNEYSVTKGEKEKKKSLYEEKLIIIDKRIANISSYYSGESFVLENEMPNFEIGADGRPTSIPLDFVVDSHHRLDIPGFGICYEASFGDKSEFHYDKDTNKFYWSDEGTDWGTYDYANNDLYALTPEEMKNSKIKGGIMFG